MNDIDKIIQEKISTTVSSELINRPIILDLSVDGDRKNLAKLFKEKKIDNVIDSYDTQIRELNEVNNPSLIAHAPQKLDYKLKMDEGVWVYFDWKRTLVHLLKEKEYVRLRTSRNAYLITDNEQKKFADAKIGFAGLNVGNPGAICITLEGGSRFMKFADLDPLSVSNLNRFRAGICDLDLNKVTLSARQAYEIDPFIDIEIYDNGITPDNIDKFLLEPKLDLLIEEMDNLKLKLLIREKAKKYKIPVLMVTADGITDVERYDLEPDLHLLAGNLKQDVITGINSIQPGKGTLRERVLLARDFIGQELLSERLNKAFLVIGTELPSIPQLSEWTFLRGAILCHVARKIVTGEEVKSGRYIVDSDLIINTSR